MKYNVGNISYSVICVLLYLSFTGKIAAASFSVDDLLVDSTDSVVLKSIYPPEPKGRSNLYNWLWGTHYRELYSTPIAVEAKTLNSISDGLNIVKQATDFQGLFLQNFQQQWFLLKPLGGLTSFMESDFFREVYNRQEFKNTYLGEFIGDAYTIINPYTFLSVNFMARQSSLIANDSYIYYIPENSTQDTVADGSRIQGKLVSLIDLPDQNARTNILTTDDLLEKIQENKLYRVDQNQYIRERLFDMLVGDWNKIPENWRWRAREAEDSILYTPVVIDRNHAFTKVDGVLFRQMLNVLSLSFIKNYDADVKDIKKINKLGFPLDMVLLSQSVESDWVEQARFLKAALTDQVIDEAFARLPSAVREQEAELLKVKLKNRRDLLEDMARPYFRLLQRTPVLTGTNQNDRFVVNRFSPDSMRVSIYNRESGEEVFNQIYHNKETKEIWLYGLEGNDHYEVKGVNDNHLPVYLISGKGDNTYTIQQGKDLRVYGYLSEKKKLDTIPHLRKIFSDSEDIHAYKYKKIKYHNIAFSPWGVYDSDNGFSLGAYFTYTMYGFKRTPFTYQHRIGYNYREGFMYQGIYPAYDGRKSFYFDAMISSPKNFFNFFGFGNNTDGYKNEKKNYNRVNIRQFTLKPSFHFDFKEGQKLIVYTSLDLFKAKRPDDRFINQYYPDDNPIFRSNYFVDFGATLQMSKKVSSLIPLLEGSLSSGWKMNLKNPGRNFPYAEATVSMNTKLTERLTWATLVNGKVLFNNKYEFYQSATTELRGFRGNRFIGKQSFYQYSDLRIDMGILKNPFTPLKYGLFAGFDYGRVWFPGEESKMWHTSYGGGVWLTLINKFTTKYSCFGSTDSFRFMFELGMGF